ncbi:hypothetical protein BpHYR1_048858 [Brachionus plicatilis]|uniref:Uncharacterized protein n=1 Tax=Brachionus plicatilis TaxID=10195 RepID=A0A3M7SLU8_BRAPC|nr:hypothetical protein BpHYR1_048858 [Brachionus plicatilis]
MSTCQTLDISKPNPICYKCFTPLAVYHLSLDEALQICLNQNCASQSLHTIQHNHTLGRPVDEKFNSFYTQDKYVSSNPLITRMANMLQSQVLKLDSLVQKFDQPKFEVFEQPQLDLITEPVDQIAAGLHALTDQPNAESLFDDLELSDFENLMDIESSIVDQSLQLTESVFAELQPVKQEEFVWDMQPISSGDVQLIGSYCQNANTSSIRIQKMEDKEKPGEEMKICDKKEKLMSVVEPREREESSGVKRSDCVPPKPALLPWEMKSKSKPAKKMPLLHKAKAAENIARVESKLNLNSNIKQLGSTLKKNILNNASLLSNLKTSNTSQGGYKDLVLSVLKKKTTT